VVVYTFILHVFNLQAAKICEVVFVSVLWDMVKYVQRTHYKLYSMLQKPQYYEIPVKVEESGEGFTPPSIQDIRYVQYDRESFNIKRWACSKTISPNKETRRIQKK
jgi:hypothetical protein